MCSLHLSLNNIVHRSVVDQVVVADQLASRKQTRVSFLSSSRPLLLVASGNAGYGSRDPSQGSSVVSGVEESWRLESRSRQSHGLGL